MDEFITLTLSRVPMVLNRIIEAEAAKERRSKNAQIIFILEEHYADQIATAQADAAASEAG